MSKIRDIKHLASIFFVLCCSALISEARAVSKENSCLVAFFNGNPYVTNYFNAFKATSIGGVDYNNIKAEWLGGGKYKISMIINAQQGVKRWYTTLNKLKWVAKDNWTAYNANTIATNCSSGLVVVVNPNNKVFVGKGTGQVTITPGPMGRILPDDGSLAIYDQARVGFTTVSQIMLQETLAIGISKEDNFPRNVEFTIELSNLTSVIDGTYNVSIVIPLGSTTTWFPLEGNYSAWWKAPDSIPMNSTITIPLVVRSENNKPANPTVNCNIPSSLEFDHGTVKPEDVKSSVVRNMLSISCDSAGSGSIEIKSDDNSSSSYANVSMKNGVYSHLSVSSDTTNFSRVLPSFPLFNGTTNLVLESALVTDGNVQPGSLSGSAVAIIKYN